MAKFYKMAKCVFSWPTQIKTAKFLNIDHEMASLATLLLRNLGQLSRQLLQPPVGSNADVGETQTRYQSVASLNALNQH